ncbi:uncharacterized protein [Antedon mediterranea]|uniref:uncharacterized protein n=1 Tax=Antedon mediterranea TaxID=105859 RepID=UPI003AF9846E
MWNGSGGDGHLHKQSMALRFINIAVFSDRTFFYHQKWYLLPATSCIFAAQREKHFKSEMNVSCDMRCDSPGFTAKFGTYTTIDTDTQKVIHVEVVQKDECPNSPAMELEGLKRTLSVLQGYGVTIKRLVSDRHSSIAAFLKSTTIIHYFDAWHIAKGIKKKCIKASNNKECDKIGKWIPSIIRMVYWIGNTTQETEDLDADGELRKQKFQSIYNHIRGIHNHETTLYPKCLHGELEPRDYIQPNSKAEEVVSNILNSPYLLRSIKQLSPTIQTYSNESFHQIINHFAPKMHHFRFKGMLARTYLAALHCNENVGRPQRVNKKGDTEHSLWYSRAKKDWMAKKHLVDPTFVYAINTIEMAMYMAKTNTKGSYYTAEMMCDPGTITEKLPKPDKTDFVAKLISRFKH